MRYCLPIVLAIAACAQPTTTTPSATQAPATTAQTVPADALEFRCPAAGVVRWVGERNVTYRGVDPSNPRICLVTLNNIATVTGFLDNFFDVPGTNLDQWGRIFPSLWPAYPGRSVDTALSLQEAGSSLPTVYREQWKVIGVEPLTVQAGTFQALVFERTQSGQGNNNFEGRWRFYYDVETRALLKRAYTHVRGRAPQNQNWEATALVRPS